MYYLDLDMIWYDMLCKDYLLFLIFVEVAAAEKCSWMNQKKLL